VTVDGVTTTHASCQQAFTAYSIPDTPSTARCIKFRGELKAAGRKTLVLDGKSYRFKIIDPQA